MVQSPYATLTSEYWQLHRNSLIFSSALFLICLGSGTQTLNVLGLNLGTVGAGALIFILLVSATYSFGAFLLEWIEEALSSLQHRQGSITFGLDFTHQIRLSLRETWAAENEATTEHIRAVVNAGAQAQPSAAALDEILSKLKETTALLGSIDAKLKWLRLRTETAKARDAIRIVGLGLVVPAVAYSVAAAHALGRLGLIYFDSFIIEFLKGLG